MNSPAPTAQNGADYLSHFGLQQPPYQDGLDGRFFYADPGLIQRLDLLQHLTQFGDMLLGVTGVQGSGKSTLAQQYLQRGNTSTWRSCQFNGAALQQPEQLLTSLADAFGLNSAATPERLRSDLLRHCQTLRHNSQLPVVVIDDAQLLPDTVLGCLLELAEDPHATLKLLRIVLFSEPGLEQRLIALGWHTPLRPLLHSMDIPRFGEEQTAAYLMYRLAAAGYSGASPFTLTEIRALHKVADGIPGRLNSQAHELLLECANRRAAATRTATPRKWLPPLLTGTIGSALVLAVVWFLQQPPGETASRPPISVPSPVIEAEPVVEQPLATPESEPGNLLESAQNNSQETDNKELKSDSPVAETDSATDTGNDTAPAPAALATDATATPRTVTPATDGPAPASPESTAKASDAPAESASAAAVSPPTATTAENPAATTTPATAPAMEQAADTAATAAASTASPPATPAEQPPATPTADAQPAPAAAATAPQAATAPVADTPAEPRPAVAPAASPTPTAAAKPATGSLDSDWLLSRPGTRFTLQLLGGRSEKSLRQYLRANKIPDPAATFRTVFKGDDWYVLVYGDFPSMAAARAAVDTLPATVRKTKPWARSFASVHEDIAKARP